jgi:hypothetical protein
MKTVIKWILGNRLQVCEVLNELVSCDGGSGHFNFRNSSEYISLVRQGSCGM